ncbi:MAG: outer membrane protein transport protein [Melioribacter sp.]|nr:outer membrane protein transport protein [Melioribacter sp.]
MKKLLQLFVSAVLFSTSIYAGGFQTGTQNARAMGMGSAFVGMVPDASAIYFNPAGLSNFKGFNLVMGTTLIMPTVDFTGPTPLTTTTSTVERTFTPINFYAAYTMDNGLSFGLGVNNPYGLGSEWPETWLGKRLAQKTELRTFYITPTVAYKVNDYFSVGGGFSYIASNVQFVQVIDIPVLAAGLPAAPNIKVNLEADGDPAIAWNLGLLFKPTDWVSFGFSFRSEATLNFNGDLTFIGLTNATHKALFPDGKGKSKLVMPWDMRFGVSLKPMKDLTVNTDFMFVGWESYKQLEADFETNTSVWKDLLSPKRWNNTFGLKLGAEYLINNLALRAGYVYDGSPIPTKYMDPSLPGANRNEFTVGVGYQFTPNIRFDAAYQFISFTNDVTDSALPFNGKYENSTNLFGFNLALSF